jgi:uncharacterized protein YndB with AHSA1/START domain
MTKESIELSMTLRGVSPEEIFDAWTDGSGHRAMTGGEAESQPVEGTRFMAWDGYVEGTHLELARPGRIVQAWRTGDFPDDAADSRLEVLLEAADGGTRVTIRHSDIPAGQSAKYAAGWEEHYFAPMREHFAR